MLLHSIHNCVRCHRINNSCLLRCFIHNLLTQTDDKLHADFIKPYFMTGENTVDPKLQFLELQPLTFMRFIIVIDSHSDN